VKLLPGYQFLGYIQNHDQIGNRAAGERISHLAGLRRAKIAAGVVLACPFIPMLFQGEEWAASSPFQYFTQHEDHALGKAVSEGRRGEFVAFGWDPEQVPDPQSPSTFENSKLRWDELTGGEHAEMLDWHKRLIALRRSTRWLSDGNLEQVEVDYDEQARWLTFRRGPLTVACNFGTQEQTVPAAGAARILIASGDVQLARDGVRMSGEAFAILAPENL
jgi:maltooligosyltrehalose trehalohydrolase